MGWTNGEQWRQLFLCGGMGFLLGAYYNAFFDRTCRFAVRRFFRDVLFCVSAALLLFLFSLGVTNGRLRAYLLVAVAAGFWVYRRTVGLMIGKLRRRIARCVTVFLRPVTDFYRKCEKKLQNRRKNCKKLLKAAKRIVYNHTVLRSFGGRRKRGDEEQTQKEK